MGFIIFLYHWGSRIFVVGVLEFLVISFLSWLQSFCHGGTRAACNQLSSKILVMGVLELLVIRFVVGVLEPLVIKSKLKLYKTYEI